MTNEQAPNPKEAPKPNDQRGVAAGTFQAGIGILLRLSNRDFGHSDSWQCLASDLGACLTASFGSHRADVAISAYEHARGRGFGADESEFARVNALRKEAFAPAQQDRVDE